MESFFSSLQIERTARKVYRTRDGDRVDVFDDIERFYNPRRRHSKLGYLSPMAFEDRALQTYSGVHETGSCSGSSAQSLPGRIEKIDRRRIELRVDQLARSDVSTFV